MHKLTNPLYINIISYKDILFLLVPLPTTSARSFFFFLRSTTKPIRTGDIRYRETETDDGPTLSAITPHKKYIKYLHIKYPSKNRFKVAKVIIFQYSNNLSKLLQHTSLKERLHKLKIIQT